MADLAQEVGLSRVWHSVTSTGEREIVVLLAFLLPLSALVIGYRRGSKRHPKNGGADKRRMCFSSEFMARGSWPPKLKMMEPVVCACMYLEGTPEASKLEELTNVMFQYGNLRSRPVKAGLFGGRLAWQEINGLLPSDVISRVEFSSAAEVLSEMDAVMMRPLPTITDGGRELPLWRFNVIQNNGKAPGDLSVVVFRFHHTIGDGMSFVTIATRILKGLDGKSLEMGMEESTSVIKEGKGKGSSGGIMRFPLEQVVGTFKDSLLLSRCPPDTPLPFGHPESGGGGAPSAAKTESYSGRRRSVPCPDVSLELVKKLKNAAGATVNDVMMSLVTGCMRRYCVANGAASAFEGKALQARGLIPVAIPRSISADDTDKVLCNKWAFVSISLCMEDANPLVRLQSLRAVTTEMKSSPMAPLQMVVQDYVMPYLPLSVCRKMVHDTLGGHMVTISNVPGPQQPVLFAGQQLKRFHMCFPNIMPQVGIVSCDGVVCTNFVVDPVAVVDSQTLPLHFVAELSALCGELDLGSEKELQLLEAAAKASTELAVKSAALTGARQKA